LFETGRFVPLEYHVAFIGEKELKAVLIGDIWNSDRDEMNKEVKAATYHQLKVEHTDQWMIQVILDI
jgi:SHS2 domain-containing protein